jgi:hypothetical protein
MRWSWRKFTAGGRHRRRCGHVVEIIFLLVFSWTHLYMHMQLTIRYLLVLNSICAAAFETCLLGKSEVSACIPTYIVMKFPFFTERDVSLQRSQETTSSPGPSARFPTIPFPIRWVFDASPPNPKIGSHPWLPIQHIYSCTSHTHHRMCILSFTWNPIMNTL